MRLVSREKMELAGAPGGPPQPRRQPPTRGSSVGGGPAKWSLPRWLALLLNASSAATCAAGRDLGMVAEPAAATRLYDGQLAFSGHRLLLDQPAGTRMAEPKFNGERGHLRRHRDTTAAHSGPDVAGVQTGLNTTPALELLPVDAVPAGHILSDLPRIYGGMWIAKRDGQLSIRDDDSEDVRNLSEVALLRLMHERYDDLPDINPPIFLCTESFVDICQRNAPDHRVPGERALAIHISRNRPANLDNQRITLVPDSTFDHWKPFGIYDFEEVTHQLAEAGDRPAAHNIACWTGKVASHTTRADLLRISGEYPDLIDAKDSGQWLFSSDDSPEMIPTSGRLEPLAELVGRCGMLIDMRGLYASFRLKILLFSQRPVLWQQQVYSEYWTDEIQPFVHYVPVRYDLSDLHVQVKWLQDNPNEARRIASHALAYAQANLTRARAVDRWADVFRSFA